MKVLLEIPDDKASSLMDLLNSIPYFKTKKIIESKALLKAEIKEAVEDQPFKINPVEAAARAF